MTQIDSTAQTDLGISDHEELLLPYKAIYSQLLDTIREVVTQTLDSAYGAGAPRITTEVLEIALKDNLSSLLTSPEKKTHHQVVKQTERVVHEANVDPKLLKMLQNTGGVPQQPDIFNQTTSQLLKLIELNNINSELNKSHSKLQQFSPYLTYNNLHKVNPYSNLLSQQQNNIFKGRETNNTSTTNTPFNPVSKPFSPPVLPTLQKAFHAPTAATETNNNSSNNSNPVAPKIFTPGVIKSESISRVSPTRSPQQAFSTTKEGSGIFSQTSPFSSVQDRTNKASSTSPVSLPCTTLPATLHSNNNNMNISINSMSNSVASDVINKTTTSSNSPSPQQVNNPRSYNLTSSPHPLLASTLSSQQQGIFTSQQNLLTSSHQNLLTSQQNLLSSSQQNLLTSNQQNLLASTQQSLLSSTHQSLLSSQQNLLTSTLSPRSTSTSSSPLFTHSPLSMSSHHETGGIPNSVLLNNGAAALLNNAAANQSAALLGNTVTSPAALLNSAANQTAASNLRNNMEVHQNFIKQINLLNQTAPSMLGQKLNNMPGQEAPSTGDIEKVLMDIQVNLTSIKPDPWGAAKDKLYKCPHCETAFARRQYLSNHIINVHNLKTCPECKTTFSNEDAFNAHLALHPKKEYECGSCNKSFNSVYLLKNHRKTHVKDKPFACNICGKTFADKYYLRNHFSIHSPVKPYSCPVCGRGFASSSALRYHSFQHTGEKPAKCQYCPSEFVQKNQLKLHIARKHKELISSLNPLHEGDIIPGNMSLGNSPTASPHHCSPKNSIVHSPPTTAKSIAASHAIVPAPPVHNKEGEAMQVDSAEPTPIDCSTKEKNSKSETPTVAMATEQLQELIASLQRTSKSNKTEGSPNNIKISSPFSKITDGINQLLEGGSVGESAPLETS